MSMATAVRNLESNINWRVTALGLNLAAWLVAALAVTAIFMHRDLAGGESLPPAFGAAIPMFEDFTVLRAAKPDVAPVDLRRIERLRQWSLEHQLDRPAAAPGRQPVTGKPLRLSSAEKAAQ
jgi:hypothetical protein